MTDLQRAQLRASEIRARLAELGAKTEFTDEETAELDKLREEYATTERRVQALTIAEDGKTDTTEPADHTEPVDREFAELKKRVSLERYVAAAAGGRAFDGAELEYAAAHELPDNHFPLHLIVEKFTAIDGNAERGQGPWIDRVFHMTAAERLGVTMRSVGMGLHTVPVIGSTAAAAQRGRAEAVTESTYTFSTTELSPTRAGIHAVYSREDALRVPGLSEAIVRDMTMAMPVDIDKKIFLGDTGANENSADISGLVSLIAAAQEITQANKVKGAETLAVFMGYVDGQYAAMIGDLRVVTTVGTNTLWASTVINSAASNQTLAAFLRENGLSWTVRGDIETATADGDHAAFVGLSRGIEGAAVAAVWDAGELIRDMYGDHATKGEMGLTLSYYWDLAMPRAANFKRIEFGA